MQTTSALITSATNVYILSIAEKTIFVVNYPILSHIWLTLLQNLKGIRYLWWTDSLVKALPTLLTTPSLTPTYTCEWHTFTVLLMSDLSPSVHTPNKWTQCNLVKTNKKGECQEFTQIININNIRKCKYECKFPVLASYLGYPINPIFQPLIQVSSES